MNLKNLKRASVIVLCAGLVVAATTGEAMAQGRGQPENRQRQGPPEGFGGGRFGGMMGDMMAPLTTRQVERYADLLGLTKDQRETLMVLHEAYAEQARATQAKSRETMRSLGEQMRESEDREGLMAKMQAAMREARDARREQDRSFNADIQAILTPAQAAKWPKVERMQRREVSMRRGLMSGERVDLVELVAQTKVQRDELAPVLELYEEELDRELIRRNEWQDKQMERMNELRRDGDFEAIQKLIEEGRGLTVKVRDVNRKYARQIAEMLPEDQRATFEAGFKRASFPDVYRPSPVSEQLEAAMKLRDLTPEQREKLEALRASHEKATAALNDKLASAIEQAEMSFDIRNLGRRGPDEDSPAATLRREKRELNRTTGESLRKVLTPEQMSKLPRPGEDNDDRRGGERRRGGRVEEN
jgi:Spy/CpxP family protein refolding chaperone